MKRPDPGNYESYSKFKDDFVLYLKEKLKHAELAIGVKGANIRILEDENKELREEIKALKTEIRLDNQVIDNLNRDD